MKKDIFIDNNIASRFTNPLDPEYLKLIKWLLEYKEPEKTGEEKTPDHMNAHLAVSNKLLREYYASAQGANTPTCIPIIIDKLTRENRLVKIGNEQIKEFQREYFTKKVERKLLCNNEDRDHIPTVLLSERKYALAIDDNFTYDLVNFPGFSATVAKKPQHIPYDK